MLFIFPLSCSQKHFLFLVWLKHENIFDLAAMLKMDMGRIERVCVAQTCLHGQPSYQNKHKKTERLIL